MDRMFQALAMNVPSFFGVVLNITFGGLRVVTMFKGDTQQTMVFWEEKSHAKK